MRRILTSLMVFLFIYVAVLALAYGAEYLPKPFLPIVVFLISAILTQLIYLRLSAPQQPKSEWKVQGGARKDLDVSYPPKIDDEARTLGLLPKEK